MADTSWYTNYKANRQNQPQVQPLPQYYDPNNLYQQPSQQGWPSQPPYPAPTPNYGPYPPQQPPWPPQYGAPQTPQFGYPPTYPPQNYPPQIGSQVPSQAPYRPNRPLKADKAEICPECGERSYLEVGRVAGPGGTVSAMRCWDCGYPVEQSGGLHGALTGAKVVGRSREAHGMQEGMWNPSTDPASAFIVGRVQTK